MVFIAFDVHDVHQTGVWRANALGAAGCAVGVDLLADIAMASVRKRLQAAEGELAEGGTSAARVGFWAAKGPFTPR